MNQDRIRETIGKIRITFGQDLRKNPASCFVHRTDETPASVTLHRPFCYNQRDHSGPCPCFKAGDTFLLKRTPQQDDFYHLMNGKFCGEAWDAVSRYVYTALQGGSIMHGWTNDERMMITCCNDGTRPVIFKIERIDIPESEEERLWLEKQNFKNTAEDAYTG